MPKRIQLSRAKGWRMPPNTVKVSRPTKWGNPFIVGQHGNIDECVRLFKLMLMGFHCVSEDNGDEQTAYMKMASCDREQLRGKNLACWCRLCEEHTAGKPFGVECAYCAPCHADVLLRLANNDERLQDEEK